MSIMELARQAGASLYTGRDYTNTQLTFSKQQLETFARLVIEAHVASVGMEPVAVDRGGTHTWVADWLPTRDLDYYTAKQMAAMRHRALEEAAGMCDMQQKTFEGRYDLCDDTEARYECQGRVAMAHELAAAIRAMKEVGK